MDLHTELSLCSHAAPVVHASHAAPVLTLRPRTAPVVYASYATPVLTLRPHATPVMHGPHVAPVLTLRPHTTPVMYAGHSGVPVQPLSPAPPDPTSAPTPANLWGCTLMLEHGHLPLSYTCIAPSHCKNCDMHAGHSGVPAQASSPAPHQYHLRACKAAPLARDKGF
eukprot:1159273-Pelagomonas_calceolata.AAC.6